MKILLIFLGTVLSLEAAKILAVFPIPALSHHLVFRTYTRELARRGYQITVITTNPENKDVENLREIDMKDILHKFRNKGPTQEEKSEEYDIKSIIEGYLELHLNTISGFLDQPKVAKMIEDKSVSFDLLITEAITRPLIALSYRFKVPIITISAFGAIINEHNVLGNMGHPLLYPSIMPVKLYNHTFSEKINELYISSRVSMLHRSIEVRENDVMRSHFGSNMPTLSELSNNIYMWLIGNHRIWERNRPTSLAVAHIGGILLTTEKPLPEDLKSYLDSSVHGVIYVSFGTFSSASLLTRQQIKCMVNALSKLRYDILWKWDEDELPGQTANIKISKWVPQQDLLRHPNIKAFITQCGLQSTVEAISAEVPLIGIPLIVDQYYNAEQYIHFGIGIKLDIRTLSEEKLSDAINNIINDESYRVNIRRLKAQLLDSPQTPLQRAVWWTEHVLRHGGQHLRSPAQNMPWIEYLEIELISMAITSAVFFIIMLVIVINYFTITIIRFIKGLVKLFPFKS